MPGPSRIEWTDATWNPVTGCTKVSKDATTAMRRIWPMDDSHVGTLLACPVVDSIEARADPFAVRLWPERLEQPLRWREPRRIFVNSMSDLFHADIPPEYIRKVFDVMLGAPHHNYQVLTKRPARQRPSWKTQGSMQIWGFTTPCVDRDVRGRPTGGLPRQAPPRDTSPHSFHLVRAPCLARSIPICWEYRGLSLGGRVALAIEA